MSTQAVNIHPEAISTEMVNGLMDMLFRSAEINVHQHSQMMKSLDAIMRIQKRFNITMMPTYLLLKFILFVILLLKEKGCKEMLKVLKIPSEEEARKLFKVIVQKNNLGEGDIMLFYKSGEKLYGDFLHLMGLFGDTVKALDYPLRERFGIREMSSVSGINFNDRSEEELKDIQCVITASFKEKICFEPPFKYVEDERGEDAELYWQGRKEQIRSYVLRDTYHWLELETNCEYCSFVFIVNTSGFSVSLTMNDIRRNCEEKLTEKDWCRFVIEKDKLLRWNKEYILYLSDIDLSMDKFIDGKEVKPWKNSINYKVDLQFCDLDEDGESLDISESSDEEKKVGLERIDEGDEGDEGEEESLDESKVKLINACDRDVQFILLDRVRKVPMLFGKLI